VSIATAELTGILNVNKPAGWTSHDVVARVRRLAAQKRVGHAGTLDPLAEGVLPVLLGRATRLADFIQLGNKTYIADVRLGTATETDDAEGRVVSEQPVPLITDELLQCTLARFTGEIFQVPPRFSALKVGGRRAYTLARAGAEVALAARPVTIGELSLLSFSANTLQLEVTCSKGTYIRALARDVAVALGTVGHLARLVRTRVGPFVLEQSVTPEHLAQCGIDAALLPASRAIPSSPVCTLPAEEAARFANGQAIQVDDLRAECVWVYDPQARLIGMGVADGFHLRPRFAL
jgi:tRNA pseudouridine55 synthase